MTPPPLLADAILPSLIWVWPIAVVLLLPIIAIEAQYARKPLDLRFGQAFRVFAVANIISSIIGFPIATVLANALQNKVQTHIYGTAQSNLEQWSRTGDVSTLSHSFGQYPRWILLVAAGFMFVLCFLISWWVEAVYVQWWIARRKPDARSVNSPTGRIVRNANLLSYALLAALSIGALAWLTHYWPD